MCAEGHGLVVSGSAGLDSMIFSNQNDSIIPYEQALWCRVRRGIHWDPAAPTVKTYYPAGDSQPHVQEIPEYSRYSLNVPSYRLLLPGPVLSRRSL